MMKISCHSTFLQFTICMMMFMFANQVPGKELLKKNVMSAVMDYLPLKRKREEILNVKKKQKKMSSRRNFTQLGKLMSVIFKKKKKSFNVNIKNIAIKTA